jgi:hypothetical protein
MNKNYNLINNNIYKISIKVTKVLNHQYIRVIEVAEVIEAKKEKKINLQLIKYI